MIRVGTAGWSYADWQGPIHPRPAAADYHGLDLLSTVFGAVEINATFYRDTTPAVTERWLARTEATGLHFTVKLHGRFTHERARAFARPSELAPALAEFRGSLGALAESPRLRALLVQFPLSFRPEPRERRYLAALLEALAELQPAPGLRPVLELRHRAWYEDPELISACLDAGASFAAIDLPAHPDHPPPGFEPAGPIGYLRLHGRSPAWFDANVGRDPKYDYRYSTTELTPIAAAAKRLDARAGETLVITNNHFSGQAVAAGVELLELLGQPPASLPGNWIEAFPDLARIAPARGQQPLF